MQEAQTATGFVIDPFSLMDDLQVRELCKTNNSNSNSNSNDTRAYLLQPSALQIGAAESAR